MNTTATTTAWTPVRNGEQVAYADAIYSGPALGTVVVVGPTGRTDRTFYAHTARRVEGRQVSQSFLTRKAARTWLEANA